MKVQWIGINIRNILLLLLMISCFSQTKAQWNFSLSTDHEYSNNPFRSPYPEAQFNSLFNLGLEREFEEINILYYGSYSRFYQSNDRNSYWHQLGFYNNSDITKFGLYAEQRLNTSGYNYFNYLNISGYLKQKVSEDFANILFQTSAGYKWYPNLPSYNNALFTLGLISNKSFESKTTLILQELVTYKNYVNTGSGSFTQDRRRYGMMSSTVDIVTTPHVSSSQLFSNIRIAQSLFENTGVAIYYQNRLLLYNSGSLQANADYNYGDESDLYDDPISRRENTFGIEITQMLPESIILKTGFSYSDRNYPSQGVYIDAENMIGNINRNDQQNIFFLTAVKDVLLDEDTGLLVKVGLSYNYIKNHSNSFWYDYNLNQVSLNIGFAF